jgi:hypothetical protein
VLLVHYNDLKADREQRKLLVQQWTWFGRGSARAHKRRVEEALHQFERFQLQGAANVKRHSLAEQGKPA